MVARLEPGRSLAPVRPGIPHGMRRAPDSWTGRCTLDLGSYRGYLGSVRVGTKELKNRLSHFLRKVRAGESVHVTDRGRVIAEIRRVEAAGGPEAEVLRTLAAEGIVTLGRGKLADFDPVQVGPGEPLSRLMLSDRR